jgi:carbon monoxide dehydrogenase subunit G
MALVFDGEERIEAPLAEVWQALNDIKVLQACIPGCTSLEKTSENRMAATVLLKIGPIKASFNGEVELKNLQPLRSYTIEGEGKGGVAGFAKGGADLTLTDEGSNVTRLLYQAKADVGGKIAQLGSRLITSTAKKVVAEFFASFRASVEKK